MHGFEVVAYNSYGYNVSLCLEVILRTALCPVHSVFPPHPADGTWVSGQKCTYRPSHAHQCVVSCSGTVENKYRIIVVKLLAKWPLVQQEVSDVAVFSP